MYKKILCVTLLLSICNSQLLLNSGINRWNTIPRTGIQLWNGQLGLQRNGVIAAPVSSLAVAQPVATGQVQVLGAQNLATQTLVPITTVRTQEVLPIQDLDVRAGPQILDVRSDKPDPVLVHFRTQATPVHVQTSHIPSQVGEVTVTQHHDEPHRVIHEIIRPVIQEIREIIQPYRKVTQEIRPVQEAVHTEVAADPAATIPTPVAPVLTTPQTQVVRTVAAPVLAPITPAVAPVASAVVAPLVKPVRRVVQNPVQVIAAQTPRLLTRPVIRGVSPVIGGSYVQKVTNNLQIRRVQTPVVVSNRQLRLSTPVSASARIDSPIEPEFSESRVVQRVVSKL